MDLWKQMSSSKCSFTCICGNFLPLNPSTTTVYARSAFYSSLRFTLSLQSAFYTQSAFYPWSAVCSPQSAVCVLHCPISFSACVPCWHDVIDKPFPKDGLNAPLSEYFFFYFGHEDVSKGFGHFRDHGCSMGLKIIFLVKLERAF